MEVRREILSGIWAWNSLQAGDSVCEQISQTLPGMGAACTPTGRSNCVLRVTLRHCLKPRLSACCRQEQCM